MKRVNFKRAFFTLSLFIVFTLLMSCAGGVKIAFFVKDPTDSWFQDELMWAQKASEDYGFDLMIYPEDQTVQYTNDLVLEDLKEAKKKGVQGAIFCLPDVFTAKPIIDFCQQNHIKMMTVDDRLKKMDETTGTYVFDTSVPHLGIDNYKTGRLVGISIAQQIVENKLREDRLGVLMLINQTNHELYSRVEGAALVLEEVLSFDYQKFFSLSPKSLDPKGITDVLNRRFPAIAKAHPEFKDWIIFSLNDDCTIAAVDYLNEYGIQPNHIYAYGINGSQKALEKVAEKNGFRGTIKLASDVHGYDTCKYMYQWITKNREPEKLITSMGTVISDWELNKK